MKPQGVIVVGAGPGVSRCVAVRFASAGYSVGLLGNDPAALAELERELALAGPGVHSRCADLTDPSSAKAALDELGEEISEIHLLHYNPSVFRESDLLELTVDELLTDVALGTGGFLTSLQSVVPRMRAGSRITATGSLAADQPWHRAATLGVQKAGMRALVDCADQALKERGIRATTLTVCGALAADGPFTPEKVGKAVFDASRQAESSWRTEIRYGA